jgi:hypothetical protein
VLAVGRRGVTQGAGGIVDEEGLQTRAEQAGDLRGGCGGEPVELEEVAGDEGAERDGANDPSACLGVLGRDGGGELAFLAVRGGPDFLGGFRVGEQPWRLRLHHP